MSHLAEIARRDFLKLSLAGAGALSLSIPYTGEAFFHNSKPHVITMHGVTNDFWGLFEHNQRVVPMGVRYDPPGLNLAYRHGEKVYASNKSDIADARRFDDSGNEVKMDAGVFFVAYSHLDDFFVKRGDLVSRETAIGTQGRTGANAQNVSHLGLRLYGNALIENDVNYVNGTVKGAVRSDLQYTGPQSDLHKHLCDPDKRTPNGKPLLESPLDGTDYDTPYRTAVGNVNEDFDLFIVNLRGTKIGAEVRRERDRVWSDPKYGTVKNMLPNRLNQMWRLVNGYMQENGIKTPPGKSWYLRPFEFVRDDGVDEVTRLAFAIAESTNTAARLFKMTSPYRV